MPLSVWPWTSLWPFSELGFVLFCFVYLYGEDFSLDSSYLPLLRIVGFLTR